MRYNCDIIQDLLPLYEENLCSEASARAVREHLEECARCRALCGTLPVEPPQELPKADQAVARSIKKVKRRWQTSLIAALLIVPLLLLGFNQVRGSGLCFTNPDDILTARRFLTALERGNWEQAARMHDYSGDYDNILEALGQPVDFWGPSFTPVSIDGEAYMLRGYLDPENIAGNAVGALFGYLYNRIGTAMIPVDLWERIIALEPEVVQQEGTRYLFHGDLYGQVSTPWGEFVISEAHSYDTAAEYCDHIDLVPAAVYTDAKTALEENARQLYADTHAAYDYVAAMTEEEFIEYMVQSYAADLKQMENLVSFDYTGFQGAYRLWENDGWHVQFGVTITYQGKALNTTMAFGVENGKVHLVSLSHREHADWIDGLEKVLYPSAHPDY